MAPWKSGYGGKILSVVIEPGVTSIGDYAFQYCSNMTSVSIPNTVQTIGVHAFTNCSSLRSVELPGSIKKIPDYAFRNCHVMERIVIPDSVTAIGEQAFSNCYALTSVRIPDSVTSIGDSAFHSCKNLSQITLSKGLTKIRNATFADCTSLVSIAIPKCVSVIEENAFTGCTALTFVSIPGSVHTIGTGAFAACSKLGSVAVNIGVRTISGSAFANCKALESIVFPETVSTIGFSAMNNCNVLADVYVYNPKCSIANGKATLGKTGVTTIYGLDESTAKSYAYQFGYAFESLGDADNSAGVSFTDTEETAYYMGPVGWAVCCGITMGIDATHFAPNQLCTRGQVVTFLWRACGSPEPKSASCPFVDVSPSRYYYKAVLWAYENGITAGIDATHFKPDDTVTRGQFVTFLWRAAGKPAGSGRNPFVDLRSNGFYVDAVGWAVSQAITAGVDATHFQPETPCNRAQVVTFLFRCFGN